MLEQRCRHGFIRSVVACISCGSAERCVPVPALPESRADGRYTKNSSVARTYRCAVCNESGHGKRWCPKRIDKPANNSIKAWLGKRPIPAEHAQASNREER